jgi:hypothetical protein
MSDERLEEARRREAEAVERLREAEEEADETLAEAERLEDEADDPPRVEGQSDTAAADDHEEPRPA